MASVTVSGVSVAYGAFKALEDVTLDFPDGGFFGLLGPSGSGKTTLLREMIGLLRPTAGEVRVFDIDILTANTRELTQLRQRWGVLFQHGALFSALPVTDNIAFPLREFGIRDERLIRKMVDLKLSLVGLTPRDGRRMPAELSGGMIKRVALARALATEPELLLLDEPTSGLDPVASERFVELIDSLRRDLALTVALVTHDLDTLADLCDRIAVLAEHRLVAIGDLAEVRNVDHPFIRSYFHGTRGRRAAGEQPVAEHG